MDAEEVIRSIRNGEKERYALLIKAYQQGLYLFCYHLLLQREEAEDAVQEVFIKGFEKLHLYTYEKSFSAWLYKIAYYHCLNQLKKRKRQRILIRLLGPLGYDSSDEGYLNIRTQEVHTLARQALMRLNPTERSLLVLRLVEGKSYEEIGQMFAYRTPALRKKMERAKKKLQKIWMELEASAHEIRPGKSSVEDDLVRGAVTPD